MNIFALIDVLFGRGLWIIQLGVLLFFLWQVDVRRRFDKKWLVRGLLLLTAFYVAKALWQTGLQYYVWKNGGLTQFFLPPYRSLTYFLSYTGFRFWLPSTVTAVFAVLFFSVIAIVRRTNPRLFYEGEEYLATLAILTLGWPRIIIYIPVTLGLLLLSSLWSSISRNSRYTPFIYVWIPTAFLIFLFGNQVIRLLGLSHFFIAGITI